MTGTFTWPVDAVSKSRSTCDLYVLTFLQAHHNIVNQQNVKLSELAEDGIYLFTFSCSPAPIREAIGPMGAPIAVH